MPSLSNVTGRQVRVRKPHPEQQARIQAEAEGVAHVTGPVLPAGVAGHDEAMDGAETAARPPEDLEENP